MSRVPPQFVQRLFPHTFFSYADVQLLWNDQSILEVSQLTFQLVEQVQPIFGYLSYVFDTVSRGSRMVSGQFQVPLAPVEGVGVEPGWVKRLVDRLDGKARYGDQQDVPPYDDEVARFASREDLYRISARSQRDWWGEQETIVKTVRATRLAPDPADAPYFFEPRQGLSIVIHYGSPQEDKLFPFFATRSETQTYTIQDVYLRGFQQLISTDGQPISELYTFLARDIRPS